MPDLQVFAACQKVIIDEEEKTASLITLLEKLIFNIPDQQTVPADGAALADWRVLCAWRKSASDAGRLFEQRFVVLRPDGREFLGNISDILFQPEHTNARIVVRMEAFPIGQEGVCWIRLYLREKSEGAEWQDVAKYAVEVQHTRPQSPTL